MKPIGECYACRLQATGFRDCTAQGGRLEPACGRHAQIRGDARIALGIGLLWALVDERTHFGRKLDERVRFVHVIHDPSGGEVRGYELREDGRAHLRYPATPAVWPEVDDAVARNVLGLHELPYPRGPQINPDGCPSFCIGGSECLDRTACPRRRACDD